MTFSLHHCSSVAGTELKDVKHFFSRKLNKTPGAFYTPSGARLCLDPCKSLNCGFFGIGKLIRFQLFFVEKEMFENFPLCEFSLDCQGESPKEGTAALARIKDMGLVWFRSGFENWWLRLVPSKFYDKQLECL